MTEHLGKTAFKNCVSSNISKGLVFITVVTAFVLIRRKQSFKKTESFVVFLVERVKSCDFF